MAAARRRAGVGDAQRPAARRAGRADLELDQDAAIELGVDEARVSESFRIAIGETLTLSTRLVRAPKRRASITPVREIRGSL